MRKGKCTLIQIKGMESPAVPCGFSASLVSYPAEPQPVIARGRWGRLDPPAAAAAAPLE
jgi:hypothetical protein